METKDFKVSNIFETKQTFERIRGDRKMHGVRYTLPNGKEAFELEDIRTYANKVKKKLADADPERKYVSVSIFTEELGWKTGGISRIKDTVRFYNLYDEELGDILAFTIYYDDLPANKQQAKAEAKTDIIRKKVKRIV